MGACYGRTDVMERSCAMARGKDINRSEAGTSHLDPDVVLYPYPYPMGLLGSSGSRHNSFLISSRGRWAWLYRIPVVILVEILYA
jgi:hypothetical protein